MAGVSASATSGFRTSSSIFLRYFSDTCCLQGQGQGQGGGGGARQGGAGQGQAECFATHVAGSAHARPPPGFARTSERTCTLGA